MKMKGELSDQKRLLKSQVAREKFLSYLSLLLASGFLLVMGAAAWQCEPCSLACRVLRRTPGHNG
jgi:hypothetical protein